MEIVVLIIVCIIVGIIVFFVCAEAQHKKREEELEQSYQEWAAKKEEEEREKAKKLADLRLIPTSSTNKLQGYNIVKQIKVISVDNYKDQDDAEYDFLNQVRKCGGTGVINMSISRHKGAYISIQGDAVVAIDQAKTDSKLRVV